MYMRGQRKVHAVEAARAQQFGFAAAEFHALLLQRLPRADGDIFLGGNGKKRHAARKRLGHPGRAQRQRGAHQRGELRIVPAGMGNAGNDFTPPAPAADGYAYFFPASVAHPSRYPFFQFFQKTLDSSSVICYYSIS